MTQTENEIRGQFMAALNTQQRLAAQTSELSGLFRDARPSRIAVVGCGSGYCLARAGAGMFERHVGVAARALAGGDLLLHVEEYARELSGGLLVFPSRSGSTTEIVRALESLRGRGAFPALALSAAEGSPLSKAANVAVELPWCFDESVCQTRTVTSLYAAMLQIGSIWGGDPKPAADLTTVLEAGDAFLSSAMDPLSDLVASRPIRQACLLADGPLHGLADEGAMAFREMALAPAAAFHVLDARHGPMAAIDDETLCLVHCSRVERELQRGLVRDLLERGALVVTCGSDAGARWGSSFHAPLPEVANESAHGPLFLCLAQVMALRLAEARKLDPDNPPNLKPWIEL